VSPPKDVSRYHSGRSKSQLGSPNPEELPDVGPKTVKTKRAGKPSADAALRKRIELAVERLLRALDTLDPLTEELEPDGNEGDDQVKTTNPMPTARSRRGRRTGSLTR
jgi:hypothetical protein